MFCNNNIKKIKYIIKFKRFKKENENAMALVAAPTFQFHDLTRNSDATCERKFSR